MNKIKKIRLKKKAQTFNLFTFIIFSFLVVVFFAGLIWAMNLINNVLHDVGVENEVNAGKVGYSNMTLAAEQIFGQQAEAIKALRMVALVYILGLGTCIILTNAFQRKHPIWFFVYILITILAVVFAPAISNAYETLLASGIYAGELNNFSASNFLLLNLPTVVLVIGALGTVLLLVNLIRGGNEDLSL